MNDEITDDNCYDNSQIECFRNCARRYYFRYVRHWKRDKTNIHLGFGSAWHGAMDVVWQTADSQLSNDEIVDAAMERFYEEWTEAKLPEDSMELIDLYPKVPGRAKEMLSWYLDKYRSRFFSKCKLIAVEEPFTVPLTGEKEDSLYYMGRWDKVYEFDERIFIVDHKTTNSDKSRWAESFSPNSQVDGYIFAGHATYGDKFYGVLIDGALVQKGSKSIDGFPPGIGFPRVPVQRLFGHLETWHWETLYYINLIRYNDSMLTATHGEGNSVDYLMAFPKNTSYCSNYSGCIYKDICKCVTNPDRMETPEGFVESIWSPMTGKEVKVDENRTVRNDS